MLGRSILAALASAVRSAPGVARRARRFGASSHVAAGAAHCDRGDDRARIPRDRVTPEIKLLSAGSAAALASIDVYYVAKRRISPTAASDKKPCD